MFGKRGLEHGLVLSWLARETGGHCYDKLLSQATTGYTTTKTINKSGAGSDSFQGSEVVSTRAL